MKNSKIKIIKNRFKKRLKSIMIMMILNDIEYKGIRDIKHLYDGIDEDYYNQ